MSAIPRLMGVNRNTMDGIMHRAVKRGLAWREEQSVSMDRWLACINREHVPGAKPQVTLGRFHVAKGLGTALDKERPQQHRALKKEGQEGTRVKRSQFGSHEELRYYEVEDWISGSRALGIGSPPWSSTE